MADNGPSPGRSLTARGRSNTTYSSRSARAPSLERITSGNHLDDAAHYYSDEGSYGYPPDGDRSPSPPGSPQTRRRATRRSTKVETEGQDVVPGMTPEMARIPTVHEDRREGSQLGSVLPQGSVSSPSTGSSETPKAEKAKSTSSETEKDSQSPGTAVDLEAAASDQSSLSDISDSEDSDHDTEEVLENRDGIADIRDRDQERPAELEKRRSRRLSRRYSRAKDVNLVTWDGPNDPENPKNWPFKRKWAATIIVSTFTFISPVSSSMVAPALTTIGSEFGITESVELSLVLSIFLLAYAIGPLILGPLSEIYGRTIVLQLANLLYLFFNMACGLARNKVQMIVFRFLSGLGGSAPLALGGGVLSDLFVAEQRGRAISIYSLAPLLGPAVGPIAGGFITANTTWRWAFWATTIADGFIQIAGLFFLQETYHPVLLLRKKNRLVKETGNTKLHTEYERPDRTLGKTIRVACSRPFILLCTQPIIQVLAVYMAFLYGMMYLMLSSFPSLWTGVYGMPIGTGGLNYISLGLGFFLGTQICAPLQDVVYRKLKHSKYGGPDHLGRPEFRVPLMFPGAVLVPVGLFIFGWAAERRTHWIVPNVGACIFAAGQQMGFQCMQTFIVDAYTRYAASAVGAVTVLRSLAGFGFPLFAPFLWDGLGYGYGGTMLGCLAVVLGIPGPFLLWKYGVKLRGMSKFAAG